MGRSKRENQSESKVQRREAASILPEELSRVSSQKPPDPNIQEYFNTHTCVSLSSMMLERSECEEKAGRRQQLTKNKQESNEPQNREIKRESSAEEH